MNTIQSRKDMEQKERRLRLKQIMADYHSGDPEKISDSQTRFLLEVKGYIIDTVKSRAGFFVNDQNDLLQECYITALEKMPGYDPDKAAVTTYLRRDLLHTISLFISANSYHSTAYYGELASKVNRAITALLGENLEPTVENIALKADLPLSKAEIGLTIVTASSEQYYESNTHGEDVITKTAETPEQEYLKTEEMEKWKTVFQDLPDRSVAMFLMYIGLTSDGKKYSYSMLSRRFGISSRQVMLEIAEVRRSLRQNRELQAYYRRKNPSFLRQKNDMDIHTVPDNAESFYNEAYRFIPERIPLKPCQIKDTLSGTSIEDGMCISISFSDALMEIPSNTFSY